MGVSISYLWHKHKGLRLMRAIISHDGQNYCFATYKSSCFLYCFSEQALKLYSSRKIELLYSESRSEAQNYSLEKHDYLVTILF